VAAAGVLLIVVTAVAPPITARAKTTAVTGFFIKALRPRCMVYAAADFAHNSRRAAHASLESMSRLELVTQDAQFEPFKGVPALAEPASGTAVVIRGVPVIRATPIVIGDTGLELHPRVCRMWDKGRTKGEGHKG
jgi:hypothetical protein